MIMVTDGHAVAHALIIGVENPPDEISYEHWLARLTYDAAFANRRRPSVLIEACVLLEFSDHPTAATALAIAVEARAWCTGWTRKSEELRLSEEFFDAHVR